MSNITNPSLKNSLRQYFSEQGDDAPTWTELHGVLCALAIDPSPGEADYAKVLDTALPGEIKDQLEQMRGRLVAQLVGGDAITLPCLLDPYRDEDGADLASWCAGFMAGVFANEPAWYEQDEEQVVGLLLPFVLISGLDDDPELDDIWQDTALVRQMAISIPEVMEELYLMFHGS